MSKTEITKPAKPTEDIDEEMDEQIEEIKNFFNDPKSKKESSKLRHCIRYVLAELATEEEDRQKAEREKMEKEKGVGFFEFLMGKKEDK